MPIDPSIILGIKPAQIQQNNPLDSYAKVLGLKNAMGQGDLQAIQLQQAQQGVADDNAVRDAYRGGGDQASILERLRSAGQYKAAQTLEKNALEVKKTQAGIDKDAAAAGKSRFDVQIQQLQHGAALLDSVTDQASWDMAKRLGQITGTFAPEALAHMPQQYDPNMVAQMKAAGLTRAQQIEQQQKTQQMDLTRRGQDMTSATATAGREVTMRGQDMTRDTALMGQGVTIRGQDLTGARQGKHYDADRGVVVDTTNNTASPVTNAGQPLQQKPNAAQQKELMSISQQEATVNGALDAVKKFPDAFSFGRGVATMAGPLSETLAGRFDSKDNSETRSYVFNVVSKVINERAGAAQSKQELARLRSFLPAEADNAKQIENKLTGFKTYLADMKKGTATQQNNAVNAPQTFDAMPDPAKFPNKMMDDGKGGKYRSDGTTWKRVM